MLQRASLFMAVVAIAALSYSGVSGLARHDGGVPSAVVTGPSQAELARAHPQAWEMHQAYDEFHNGPDWYGAFAVGGQEAFGAVSGYADAALAEADALALCADWAADCRVVATITPAEPQVAGLSGPQARELAILRSGREGGRALAVDERGHWGSAWGYPNRHDAGQAAMADCIAAQQTPSADTACRVVWTLR
ncbi:hypothetical protein [Vannielia sp. SX4]|uniref:hypothetical protein n=1 Tax=Vannielia sp. SX4 TaxID=3463852 RepID=UPI004059860B